MKTLDQQRVELERLVKGSAMPAALVKSVQQPAKPVSPEDVRKLTELRNTYDRQHRFTISFGTAR